MHNLTFEDALINFHDTQICVILHTVQQNNNTLFLLFPENFQISGGNWVSQWTNS